MTLEPATKSDPESAGQTIARLVRFWLGPILFGVALIVPLPAVGDDELLIPFAGRAVLGLSVWMAVWWINGAMPLAATSLLPLVVLPIFTSMNAGTVATAYWDDIIVLFLGGFCLALAMERTGLHRQIAATALSFFGTKPRRVILGLLASTACISMWVSNTATAVAMLPVAVTIGAVVGQGSDPNGSSRATRRFRSACVLAVALGASVGGIGTLIGTPPNVILQSQYSRLFAAEIMAGELPELTFGRWMMLGLPLVLLLVPFCWWILTRVTPGVPREFDEEDRARVQEVVAKREPLDRSQRAVLIVFGATALLWLTRSRIEVGGFALPLTGWDRLFAAEGSASRATDGMVAALAALVLFALPLGKDRSRLLTWEFAERRLPWGAMLLFGGGLALAQSFSHSGLSEWLVTSFTGISDAPTWLVVLIIVVGMTILSEVASNTAAAQLAIPILASVAVAAGTPPLLLMAAGALGASCGYALPAATPPNTIAIATGVTKPSDLLKAGLLLDLGAVLLMSAVVVWIVPFLLGG